MASDKSAEKRKPPSERRRFPVGTDPRRDARRERAAARLAVKGKAK